ncbi:cAMP phosphodiesterases class-II-domain-containing protein [Infundibulicybe gibba]|nr:cAMP phosphodiesterases class-II-domain-containing protein [Infundibulicybe gibba]
MFNITHRYIKLFRFLNILSKGPPPEIHSRPPTQAHIPLPMPTFDMVVIGSGGGPDETNLSAYLFKPSGIDWDDDLLALEAGSGQGALNRLLLQNPDLFGPSDDNKSKHYSAAGIYSRVRCFLITHAHLDHVNSLVMSAGSLGGARKRICAAKQTLQDLESVFSDRLWPNLASWNEDDEDYKLLYTSLRADNKYKSIYPDVSVRIMPVSHGCYESGNYDSAAFFVRRDSTGKEFLFFGDVEPDSVAAYPQTLNVWRAAAPKIPNKLSNIFIECSWPSGRADNLLYGHLNPEHLMDELTALATEVVHFRKGTQNPVDIRGALDGVRVIIIHCKDDMTGKYTQPTRNIITQQVKTLMECTGLGAEILAAEPGMCISTSNRSST